MPKRLQSEILSLGHGHPLLDSITDGCIVLDRDWRFTYVNERALDIHRPLAKTSESLLGRDVFTELPALETSGVADFFRSVVGCGSSGAMETFCPPLESWFNVRAFPSEGGLVVLFENTTRRKQADVALEAERRLLRLVAIGTPLREVLEALAIEVERHSVHGMMCSILLLDDSGRKLLHGAAPSLPDTYNRAIDGLVIGSSVGSCGTAAHERRVVAVEDIASHPYWSAFAELAKTHGLAACTSIPIVSADGAVRGTIASYYAEPRLPDPIDVRLTEVARDIAAIAIERERARMVLERAAAEREALLESERRARSEVEHASRAKDEFLATLSHELRTPLGSILGWAHVLRSGNVSEDKVARGLEVIERNAITQARLIDDLLDMSRIIAGKLRLEIGAVDPASIVDAAIDTVKLAAEAKGVRIERISSPSAGSLMADPARLQQIVWNLLANAIKFTPKGGSVRIHLDAPSGAHVDITVTDTGAGIEPTFLSHVFERFRQAESTITRTHGGLGLGLAIVKQLVELHGGSISVRSEGRGKGASFSVRLPVVALAQSESGPTSSRRGPEHIRGIDLSGLRVLVVDDQADARELVAEWLRQASAIPILADGALAALARIEESVPDVLVSDIGMPQVDGFDLIRRVRALSEERGGRIPAIALSAFARPDDRTKAVESGYAIHVAKPVDSIELLTTIANVAGRI